MTASARKINPNASKNFVFSTDLSSPKTYPKFIEKIQFVNFRHINDLTIEFKKPVTVVSGANKSGKTTLLLAIACSHFHFEKRNYSNGAKERQTWSDVLKLTNHDKQASDWTYHLWIKSGDKREMRRGQRKALTKKWNGVGKKETQIKDVAVIYLDLDRILPARYASPALHRKAQNTSAGNVSAKNQKFIEDCLSYIFEQKYSLNKLAVHGGKDLFGYSSVNNYSSYNSASGEDVVARILIDCIDAPAKSLILIDEIELGLHPGVQRRLMDIIFEISCRDQKQFVITSHSATIISTVPDTARVFIGTKGAEHYPVSPISINAALSKMDAKNHPLIDLFCEDPVAVKLIQKALGKIESTSMPGLSGNLINVIESGSANDTYTNFQVRKRTFDKVKIRSGHCCVLDGDMKILKGKNGILKFPSEEGLFFLPGDAPPERVLCDLYEKTNSNSSLRYHIDESDPHCLMQKMMEIKSFQSKDEVFDACWDVSIKDETFRAGMNDLVKFLRETCQRFSPDL